MAAVHKWRVENLKGRLPGRLFELIALVAKALGVVFKYVCKAADDFVGVGSNITGGVYAGGGMNVCPCTRSLKQHSKSSPKGELKKGSIARAREARQTDGISAEIPVDV